MRLVLDINDNKAIAFLNFIKSLDFITVKDEFVLSEEEKKAIDIGLNDIELGNVFTNKEVMSELKKIHPSYFK
jgi:hypothetical protein